MSDTTPVLSPCPFCGSVTRIHSYSKRIGKATPTLFQTAQVKCKKQSCGMSGPLVKGDDCRRRAAARFNAAIQPRLDQQRIIPALSEDASKAAELALEVERLRARLNSPDFVYDPEDWEATYDWASACEMEESLLSGPGRGPIARVCTLIKGPDRWVADVPIAFDSDGDADGWEVRWFDSEDAARAALDAKP